MIKTMIKIMIKVTLIRIIQEVDMVMIHMINRKQIMIVVRTHQNVIHRIEILTTEEISIIIHRLDMQKELTPKVITVQLILLLLMPKRIHHR